MLLPRSQHLRCVRKGGRLSIPGVYIGNVTSFPMGAFVAKGLTMKSGQTHVQRYLKPLLDRIAKGEIDPSFVVTHTMSLEEAPQGYEKFNSREDECINPFPCFRFLYLNFFCRGF